MHAVKVIALLTAVSTAIYAQTGPRAVTSAKIVIEGRPGTHQFATRVDAAVILFLIGGAWLLVRGFFRWMAGRYQHHGVALGFGPLYFYFRKRRSH